MTGGILTGLGFGAGLALLLRWAWPARPSLAEAVARLRSGAVQTPPPVPGGGMEWEVRLGALTAAMSRAVGLQFHRLRPDLVVLERPLEVHLAHKALATLTGALVAPAAAGLLKVSGLRIGWLVPGWVALSLGIVGFWLPDHRLQTAATRRRRELRTALGMLLNVVAVNLAGGAEVEEAIQNALSIGSGHAFALLRRTMQQARLSREKVWAAWGRLGEQLDAEELRQLAQHLVLAGDEGARMRQALVAMAQTLRRNEIADAEIRATEASERMVLPLSLLSTGFLLLLVVPALLQIATTFHF